MRPLVSAKLMTPAIMNPDPKTSALGVRTDHVLALASQWLNPREVTTVAEARSSRLNPHLVGINWYRKLGRYQNSLETPANGSHVAQMAYQKKSCKSAVSHGFSPPSEIVVSPVRFRVSPFLETPAYECLT
jgi:hypothetical protein